MGTTVVAIKEIHRVVKPGERAKEKGQRGTPPEIRKIAVGTKFVVDDEKELDFLRKSKSVKDPETQAQIAEAKVNLTAFDDKKANFAESEEDEKPKSRKAPEVTTTSDKPAKKGRGKAAKAEKAASDLI